MWSRWRSWFGRRGGAEDRAELRACIERLDAACSQVHYASLPAVGGTAHVLKAVCDDRLFKAVGRTRLEAYRTMVESLEADGLLDPGGDAALR